MTEPARRIVTGHDSTGRSIVLSDGVPPQHHAMRGRGVGADFIEIWSEAAAVPQLTAEPAGEPNERPFTIMPQSGHLLRLIELYPAHAGGKRTVMHRTKTLDYAIVLEGEVVLILEDSEVRLRKYAVVVQRGTNHAWENRSETPARMAFFHIDAEFNPQLLDLLPKPLELMR